MTFNRVGKTLFLTGSLAATCAQANNAEDSNKSNIAPGANLQDNYPPRLYDSNAHTNDVLPRATLPISPHYIPIGPGVGKVWKSGSHILNVFIEPLWTARVTVCRNSPCTRAST